MWYLCHRFRGIIFFSLSALLSLFHPQIKTLFSRAKLERSFFFTNLFMYTRKKCAAQVHIRAFACNCWTTRKWNICCITFVVCVVVVSRAINAASMFSPLFLWSVQKNWCYSGVASYFPPSLFLSLLAFNSFLFLSSCGSRRAPFEKKKAKNKNISFHFGLAREHEMPHLSLKPDIHGEGKNTWVSCWKKR